MNRVLELGYSLFKSLLCYTLEVENWGNISEFAFLIKHIVMVYFNSVPIRTKANTAQTFNKMNGTEHTNIMYTF